jgi:DNA repair exonuclease SbcCD ATPase subunit
MKIKSLIINNIGLVKSETIKIDKPLILFYGDIKQGKTTILNCIRWAFGGSFPKDILTHGEEEGFIELQLENGLVNRSFYINRDGETVARDLKIILNNRPGKVADLKRFLNPFLLNQNFLTEMTESERNKFIVELFQIETIELDSDLIKAETKAQNLRATIKGYGSTQVQFVEKPNIEALNAELAKVESELKEQREAIEADNKKTREEYTKKQQSLLNDIIHFNDFQESKSEEIELNKQKLQQILGLLEGALFQFCFSEKEANEIISSLPVPESLKPIIVNLPEPTYCTLDESELINIKAKLSEADIQQVKYEQYLKESVREDEKMRLTGELKELEGIVKRIRLEKSHKQEEINGIIEGLVYKDFRLWYEDTSFEMLSTSQIMGLSSKLSALYPESLSLELIDRGESMGKSIMGLIDKATKEDKNILVTVVGEKPANVPENVGVFVVENGVIS